MVHDAWKRWLRLDLISGRCLSAAAPGMEVTRYHGTMAGFAFGLETVYTAWEASHPVF